ncbi:hypothetical protein, partial [Okeania sp. SIO3I5]|uniref:hypothetical protein n=1 Tax=Okeania sp. SIO3I5 TaxID=2607805 RepID=UPI0025DE95E1
LLPTSYPIETWLTHHKQQTRLIALIIIFSIKKFCLSPLFLDKSLEIANNQKSHKLSHSYSSNFPLLPTSYPIETWLTHHKQQTRLIALIIIFSIKKFCLSPLFLDKSLEIANNQKSHKLSHSYSSNFPLLPTSYPIETWLTHHKQQTRLIALIIIFFIRKLRRSTLFLHKSS